MSKKQKNDNPIGAQPDDVNTNPAGNDSTPKGKKPKKTY